MFKNITYTPSYISRTYNFFLIVEIRRFNKCGRRIFINEILKFNDKTITNSFFKEFLKYI